MLTHRLLSISAAALFVFCTHHASAAPSCPAFEQASSVWDAHGFGVPQKPGQAYVDGADGSRISGADYRAAALAIRSAARACARGETEAADRFARVALSRMPATGGTLLATTTSAARKPN